VLRKVLKAWERACIAVAVIGLPLMVGFGIYGNIVWDEADDPPPTTTTTTIKRPGISYGDYFDSGSEPSEADRTWP
jgi:hypothetical protein